MEERRGLISYSVYTQYSQIVDTREDGFQPFELLSRTNSVPDRPTLLKQRF